MSDEHHDYRGYAGELASGVFRVASSGGAPVRVVTRIAAMDTHDGPLTRPFAALGHAAAGGRRGRVPRRHDLPPDNRPARPASVDAIVCSMFERPLSHSARYRIKHTSRTALAKVDAVRYQIDVNTLHRNESAAACSSTRSGASGCASPHPCSSTSTAATGRRAASSSSTSRRTTPSVRAWSCRTQSMTAAPGLPPGPSASTTVQSVQWIVRPTAMMERCHRRYGDMFTLRLVHEGPGCSSPTPTR